MRFVRGFLIFSYGLFTIAAQALLFREFITTFEGNDISVGLFFGSWLLWVGLGAIFVSRAKTLAEKLLAHVDLVFLGYLVAFILELVLIIQVREIAGIESYELLSVRAILFLSILVIAPVSITTGVLFPLLCRWIDVKGDFAVSRVYIFEAAGSFVGGLGVTFLLGVGESLVRIFFILAIIVSFAVFAGCFVQWIAKKAKTAEQKTFEKKASFGFWGFIFSVLVLFSVCICLVFEADKSIIRYLRIVKWTKLLPKDAFIGSFQTAQAEYLYGVYHDQWVAVREGGVCEALPDKSTAGRIAALSLCQHPRAERVLIVGSGLGLCRELLSLSQIQQVSWSHPDSEYVRNINRFIPEELRINDERFEPLAGEVRSLLFDRKDYYDLVILNLPDATSSVLNRYFTVEFYRQVKESMRPDGVLAVRVTGGENIMGTELINLGASAKKTLNEVFSHLVLTPGEDTWFIVSDSERLTGNPAVLRDRFAGIKGAGEIFKPEALLSVYLPERAEAALKSYADADLPRDLLINRDSRPLTHLYSLLFAAKQSGAPLIRLVKLLLVAGVVVFLVPIFVFVVLRLVFILDAAESGRRSSFDSSFLVFSAGWVSIGVVIVLMYMYQTRFGSLYLHIGVISSLFMVGLTVGASLISRLIRRGVTYNLQRNYEALLISLIIVHTLILGFVAFWPIHRLIGSQLLVMQIFEPMHLIFAIAFFLCGLCSGCYFPTAAVQLTGSGYETGQTGGKLEAADHIGGSVGGMATSLFLVPVLGTRITIFVFIALILVNVPPIVLRLYRSERTLGAGIYVLRKAGYILFGVGISLVLCSNLLAEARERLRPALPEDIVFALAGEKRIESVSAILTGDNRRIDYFKVYEDKQGETGSVKGQSSVEELAGYIFSSEELAPEIKGFGGRMNLAIYVDRSGRLVNFHIIRSNETPSYLELIGKWRQSLNGSELFSTEPFSDVDAVTGATISSKAVLLALERSGQRFATQLLGQKIVTGDSVVQIEKKDLARWVGFLPDLYGGYLIVAVIFSLVVTYRGGFISRLVVLIFNLIVGGIVLNTQYSSEQMVTLLSLYTPAVKLTGVFLLVIAVPILVIFFGNIYCGYICPFGAAQELVGYVLPERFKEPISAEKMAKARFVKYILLLVLIVVFFVSRNRTTLAADPLISAFNFRFLAGDLRFSFADWKLSMFVIVIIVFVGSLFYTRFWCRYLCPVGGFLSLFNKVVILKKYLPIKRYGKCEFGLGAKDNLDCIYCDRCRYQAKPGLRRIIISESASEYVGRLSRYLVAGVLVVGLYVSAVSVRRFLQVIPRGVDYTTTFVSSGGGQPRDVDLQRMRTLIEQKRLSDREAEYYKKVE